ncbi:hypothetical protein PMAYCL1PPCAC_06953 [Pristionchus mayeri]|uniref:FHA domain-containing protein n=1 Tax=Pristionchus mayeri TaxID=1317129 RepID=A0AAN4Z916_9BILA|nr:hypothetical protein PMAYCL1PPCAC_06953 [Pristionchus mayeri]
MIIPTYHLRRVTKTNHPEELILLGDITKFGRNADNVDVVLTSAVYSNMISRDHATITGTVDPITRQIVSYKIRDNSLNGTYIDDKRVYEEMILNDSSVIKFGHMNGAAIKPGVAAPQANAEFSFVFEKCSLNRRYIGWEGYERRRTVVCTGDGKFMSETGEDHRTKRKPPPKEQVSSTTAPIPPAFPMQHPQPIQPPTSTIFNPALPPNAIYQYLQMQQHPHLWPVVTKSPSFPHANTPPAMRANGQIPMARSTGTFPTPAPPNPSSIHAPVDQKPSSSVAPIRSPPVECDSSVPSPPKTGADSRTGHADSSSQQSPKRGKDDDEDSFSVPDSPPRAPRPLDLPGRSVTNSPAPPSPRLADKVETPKEEKKKAVVTPKKPTNPGKAPKSGGGGEKRSSNKEVDRLLTDLTEGSFMMQARRKSQGGVGSERRKMLNEGKKQSAKRAVSKNKLHRQLSSASSDDDSDDDEASGVSIRPSSSSVGRPSMVGKKASSASTPKGTKKGVGRSKKKDSEESDPYEETDDESDKEMKNGKRKMSKKSALSEKKEKKTPKAKPKKKAGRKKKKASEPSTESDSGGDEDEEEEFHDTENTKCDAEHCLLPKQSDVFWVRCDGCKKWSHNFCLFGTNLPYEGKTFFCGCGKAPSKKKKS